MIESDIQRIEESLEVSLPSDYRHLLRHFPIRSDVGTSDGPLWDDASAIIERNNELRTARRYFGTNILPISDRFLFIGDDGAGWQHLIDLASEPSIVYIMEHEDVKRIRPELDAASNPQSVTNWFHAYLLELKDDGVDITAEAPPKTDSLSWGCILGMLACCLLAAFAMVLMIVGVNAMLGR